MPANFCTHCGGKLTPGNRFCTQCGTAVAAATGPGDLPPAPRPSPSGATSAPMQPAQVPPDPRRSAQVPSVGSSHPAVAYDIARHALAGLLLLSALATAWDLGDATTDEPLALGFLVLAMFGLVSDFVLQRAVVGRDVPPLPRLLIRAGLVLPLIVLSLFTVVTGELGDRGVGDDGSGHPTLHLYPAVGFGPLLALLGAMLVIGGRWLDRTVLPARWWQWAVATLGTAAALLSAIELIRGMQGASTMSQDYSGVEEVSTGSMWAAMVAPWLGILLLAVAFVLGVLVRPSAWPGVSLVAAAWSVTALGVAVVGGAPSGPMGEGHSAYAVGGSAFLLAAAALATAPGVSAFAAVDAATRWVAAARVGVGVTAAGLLMIAIQTVGLMSLLDSSGGTQDKGALVWVLIGSVFGAAGAAVSLAALRNPAQGRRVGAAWGVVVTTVLGSTWMLSDLFQEVLGQGFGVGLTSGFTPTVVVALPAGVALCLLVPPSMRAQFGAVLPESFRQTMTGPAPGEWNQPTAGGAPVPAGWGPRAAVEPPADGGPGETAHHFETGDAPSHSARFTPDQEDVEPPDAAR